MIPSNSPAVGLTTRRWLQKLANDGVVHNEGVKLMVRSLHQCRDIHPGGMVFDMSLSLGANRAAALVAGSIAEMFYTVCSLTDDIQDGDTARYFPDIKPSLILNMQSQFLCLIAVRANDLLNELGSGMTQQLVTEIYRTGAAMLTGQQYEISRSPWDATVYDQVASLSAGEQFGLYIRLSATVGKKDDIASFVKLGRIYGTLLQYVADKETHDARLDIFDPFVLFSTCERLATELDQIIHCLLDENARKPFEWLLKRCDATFHYHN